MERVFRAVFRARPDITPLELQGRIRRGIEAFIAHKTRFDWDVVNARPCVYKLKVVDEAAGNMWYPEHLRAKATIPAAHPLVEDPTDDIYVIEALFRPKPKPRRVVIEIPDETLAAWETDEPQLFAKLEKDII